MLVFMQIKKTFFIKTSGWF